MSENQETPNWLKELQQKSWEPEILLSGIVLYGMFQLPGLLDRGLLYFTAHIYGQSSDLEAMVSVFKIATYWLILGLVLHLVTRGIWVGMVGLSYTFPNGVNTANLNYKEKFHYKVSRIPKFQKVIIHLEKVCSSIFSVSFLLFMIMIGAYLYLFFALIIPFFILYLNNNLSGLTETIFDYYSITVVVVGMLGLIDFITMGYFRRFRIVAKLFWPLHWIVSILTFSRYYRSIYYGLVSNVNKWYMFIFLLTFTVLNFFLMDNISSSAYQEAAFSRITYWGNTIGQSAFSGHYDDQNENRPSVRASIPSDIIDENTLRLFIVANISNQDSIDAWAKKEHISSRVDTMETNARALEIIKSFYHIYLDDSLIEDYPMKFHFKSHTRQMGYLVYLDITDLPKGLYEVQIGGPPEMYRRMISSITFYREKLDFPTSKNPIKQGNSEDSDLKTVKPFIIGD